MTRADTVDFVSPRQAAERCNDGALLVDVRPQVARHLGSVADAVIVERDHIADAFGRHSPIRLPEAADPGREIIIVSVSNLRSCQVAEQLAQMGYTNVRNLDGGFNAWKALELSVALTDIS